jgi:hypothetical protein
VPGRVKGEVASAAKGLKHDQAGCGMSKVFRGFRAWARRRHRVACTREAGERSGAREGFDGGRGRCVEQHGEIYSIYSFQYKIDNIHKKCYSEVNFNFFCCL